MVSNLVIFYIIKHEQRYERSKRRLKTEKEKSNLYKLTCELKLQPTVAVCETYVFVSESFRWVSLRCMFVWIKC